MLPEQPSCCVGQLRVERPGHSGGAGQQWCPCWELKSQGASPRRQKGVGEQGQHCVLLGLLLSCAPF